MPPPRFLFSSVPLQGHFWPALCVACALSKLGADVTFAAYEEVLTQGAEKARAANVRLRPLPALDASLRAELGRQIAVAQNKALVPPERRAPRVGSTVFPFYEEHMYGPLLAVAKEMVAEAQGGAVVIVSEHACLAAHDVAETLGLPLALLWQLPLQYALTMGGANECARRDRAIPVELPGAVLPSRMSLWQRLVLNPRLRRRQMRVLEEEYIPKRIAARERAGVAVEAQAAGRGSATLWRGDDAPFAPAKLALPRPALHIVSGSMLFEPEAMRRHALPQGWSVSGPMGVDLSGTMDDKKQQQHHHHHPAVASVLAEAERDPERVSIVYVAFGTLAAFEDRAMVEAMARAFVAVARGGGGSGDSKAPSRTYVIWSLPPSGQALLPADLLNEISSSDDDKALPLVRVVVPSAGKEEEGAPSPHASPLTIVPRTEQQALLSHPSVGLFVSHCGLNSLCEALVRGVPLVAWPLFADQYINSQHAANERVGVVVPDDGEDGDGSCRNRALLPGGGTRRDAPSIEAIVRSALADGGMRARARALGERLRGERKKSGAEEAAGTLASAFLA